MEWSDEGIVVGVRTHGESSAIVTLLTRANGRHAGLVRGGIGRRLRGILQPGNEVSARWRARLAEHLGHLECELVRAHAAALLDDGLRLAGLDAACAMASASLPEREPHVFIFNGLKSFLHALSEDDPAWPSIYVKWEIELLSELGYGLDFRSCAATGRNDQLAYVSPRSGQAVSLAAGEPYRNKLLPLPRFLLEDGTTRDAREIADGLRLAAFFLERHALRAPRQGLPAARRRLSDMLARRAMGAPSPIPPPAA
jgi:DNA repair protein RecO (recombination protein O)